MSLSINEQYLLELINRGRLDPLAEAKRYGVDLNAGLATATISAEAKQVLASNANLNAAALGHSTWMLEADVFSHTGKDGSSQRMRVQEAGYTLGARWGISENIAWYGTSGALDLKLALESSHAGLYRSSGHRLNTFNPLSREVGLSQVEGLFTTQNTSGQNVTYKASMITENFAWRGGEAFVTGVVYHDRDGDNFYTPGEGLSGIAFYTGQQAMMTELAGGYALKISSADTVADLGISYDSNVTAFLTLDMAPGNAKADLVRAQNGTWSLALSASAILQSGTVRDAKLLGVAALNLTGSDEDNVLTGNAAANQLAGGKGNDTLIGGGGNDTLTGGAGADSFVIAAEGRVRITDFDPANDRLDLSAWSGLRASSQLVVTESQTGELTITYGSYYLTLARAGGPALKASDLNANSLPGITWPDPNAPVTLTGGAGADVLRGGAGHDTLYGGGGDDQIFGNDGNDRLFGGAGDDTLSGGAGADTLDGGAGNNILTGGAGADTFVIAAEGKTSITDFNLSNDRIDLSAWSGLKDFAQLSLRLTDSGTLVLSHGTRELTITFDGGTPRAADLTSAHLPGLTWPASGVASEFGQSLTGQSGNDVLTGSAGDDLILGEDGNDRLFGGDGNDQLFGGAGADTLDGGAGNNTLSGGLGNDRYIIRSTSDVIQGEIGYSQGGGIDTVESWIDFTLGSNVEILRLQGDQDLVGRGSWAPESLVGNSGNNVLDSSNGIDQLNGKSGNDTLIGGIGADTLVGEDGADVFVFRSLDDSRPGQANRDFINGFFSAEGDRIDLRLIDANTQQAGDQAFSFIGSKAFSGTAGELRFFTWGTVNHNIVQADVNGDGVADMEIFVNLTRTMQASDFLL